MSAAAARSTARTSTARTTTTRTGTARTATARTANGRASTARAVGSPARPATRPLALVPRRRAQAPRAPFLVVVVGLLVTGLLGLLALNTVLAQDSFTAHELGQQNRELLAREQALRQEVEARTAPGALAAAAAAQGMVPGGPPQFLDLRGGGVVGTPTASPVPPADAVVPPAAAVEVPGAAAPAPVTTQGPVAPPAGADDSSADATRGDAAETAGDDVAAETGPR